VLFLSKFKSELEIVSLVGADYFVLVRFVARPVEAGSGYTSLNFF
jgi:hypothetical protein